MNVAEVISAQVEVRLNGMEPISRYAQDSTMAAHPDAKQRVRPTQAIISIIDGKVEGVTLRGRVVKATGEEDGRYNSTVMLLGYTDLAQAIAASAVTQLRNDLT